MIDPLSVPVSLSVTDRSTKLFGYFFVVVIVLLVALRLFGRGIFLYGVTFMRKLLESMSSVFFLFRSIC